MDAVSACISDQDARTERSNLAPNILPSVRSSLSVNVCFSLCQTATQRPVAIPFSSPSRIPYIREIYWREVGQCTSLTNYNGKFQSDRCEGSNWNTSRGGPKYSNRTEPKRTFLFHFRPKFSYFLV